MATYEFIMLAVEREPIRIGERLRVELRREIARLMAEWKASLGANRREIERQITAIFDLLGDNP